MNTVVAREAAARVKVETVVVVRAEVWVEAWAEAMEVLRAVGGLGEEKEAVDLEGEGWEAAAMEGEGKVVEG